METPLHECGLCFNELVFGFCENCSCRLCEKCFSNHKRVTMFIDHTIFPFDKSTQSANISVERTPDIHQQKCSIHLTDANSFYCEKDDATICGRCMHANHRACLDDIIDLNNVRYDEYGTNELTNTLKQLGEEISGIEKRVAENLKLNDECKESCLTEITEYTQKLNARLNLLRENAVENVNVKHKHNDNNIRVVENLCKEANERIMEKCNLINDLSHKKHERHLFVVSKRLGKEVDEIKTIIRQSNLENNFAKFSFLPNKTIECTLQNDFTDIGQLQETCDGSEEVVEDFPEICNELKGMVVDADFALPHATVSVSVEHDSETVSHRRVRNDKSKDTVDYALVPLAQATLSGTVENDSETVSHRSVRKDKNSETVSHRRVRNDKRITIPVTKRLIVNKEVKKEDTCPICMENFNDFFKAIQPKMLECGDIFCKECIDKWLIVKQSCPTCGRVCGTMTGNQPPGKMTVSRGFGYCTGYATFGRITILYEFLKGRQSEFHPVPGAHYRGITRTAFLPDNEQGQNICRMLKVAFERKLVFTIGNSRTTGQEGVITWNDIQHKTDHRPYAQFGYPDPTYLDRVTDDLKAKGVTLIDIKSTDTLEGIVITE